jgi:ribosomal protein S14
MINFNKTQKRQEILLEYLKRQKMKNFEIKKIILKAVELNKNQTTKIKLLTRLNFKNPGRINFNKQQNRCLFTGRVKGFQKKTASSRQTLKILTV